LKKTILYILVFIGILNTSLLADITSNLIAHYEFEDNTNDSSGNSFNLTGNNPAYTTGKIGQAYSFNGSDNNITAINTGLNDDNGTISYWIKTDTTEVKTLIALGVVHPPNYDSYVASGEFGINGLNSGTTINDNVWHHIVVTFEGVNTTKVYIDNTLVFQGLTGDKDVNLGSNIYLGHWQGGNKYIGSMDDVRIYNRTLTDADISQLYNFTQAKLTLQNHGGVLQFDNNNAQIQASKNLNIGSNHTIEFWINTTDLDKEVMRIDDTTPWSRLYVSASGKIASQLGINSSNSNIRTSTTSIDDGQWHHIAMTYKNDGNMTLYFDGNLDESYLTGTVAGISLTNASLTIGNMANISSKMQLDEVRIWNTTRTKDEIQSNMNHQLDGNETGLIAYYNFDERIGDTIYDITSNNNDGTIEGDVTRLNFLGDNLEFDSTGEDYIDIGNIVTTQTDNISFGTWFKWNGTLPSGAGDVIMNIGSNEDVFLFIIWAKYLIRIKKIIYIFFLSLFKYL